MDTGTPAAAPAGGTEVVLRQVSRSFGGAPGEPGIVALARVDLRIEPGTTVALTGPSGSGKSTLLHVIGAIERPDSGEVVIGGTDIARLGRRELVEYRRTVGLVFQRFNLIPALTALDNVMAPVIPQRTTFDKRERALALLDAVGLAGRERSAPAMLSGGQQQRVAIARALINGPSLVLADEPTGNLDTAAGESIVDLLLGLRDDFGVTIVIATHDERVAQRCDRALQMLDGRLSPVRAG